MKIAKEKQVSFLNRIIDDTKYGSVFWESLPANSIAALSAFPVDGLDPEGVFKCEFRNRLDCKFLIAQCDNMELKGSIGVNYEQMVPIDHDCEEIAVLLFRLFYLIYEKRPNINKVIDDYLSLDQNQT